MHNKKKGFTLIEVLIVIGIIAILATVVLVAVNPSRQFALARNTQRTSNLNALLNAIGQNIADNKGTFTCAIGTLPATSTPIKIPGGYDIRPCAVPVYLSELPLDPESGKMTSSTDYDTGYSFYQDSSTKRITVLAPAAELGQTISITR